MKRAIAKTNDYIINKFIDIKSVASNNRGEGYIDTAIKILISVVLGALLLAGLYMLFGDVVMPTLNERITDMFNYAG
ncbi:MAG TPA: hypothetical protein GX396_11025 [Tissierellia bacterium]|nr:hypothetical protein [Tissierellia bacterium]